MYHINLIYYCFRQRPLAKLCAFLLTLPRLEHVGLTQLTRQQAEALLDMLRRAGVRCEIVLDDVHGKHSSTSIQTHTVTHLPNMEENIQNHICENNSLFRCFLQFTNHGMHLEVHLSIGLQRFTVPGGADGARDSVVRGCACVHVAGGGRHAHTRGFNRQPQAFAS